MAWTCTTRRPSAAPFRCSDHYASRCPATASAEYSGSSTGRRTTSSTRWTVPAPGSPRRWRTPRRSAYAEADPSADIDGFDAAAKAAILASIAFHSPVVAADVHREGIAEVTSADIASARDMDAVVKFVAICELSEDERSVGVRVHPAMLPRSTSAGQRSRRVQRRVRRERRGGAADVLRSRRRRRADGQCRSRRPRDRRAEPADRRRRPGRLVVRRPARAPHGSDQDPLPHQPRRRRPTGRPGRRGRRLRRSRRLDRDGPATGAWTSTTPNSSS